MNRQNKAELEGLRGGQSARIVLLREFEVGDGQDTTLDVPDPYYTGGFDEVFAIVDRCCRNLMNTILTEESGRGRN